MANKQPLVSVIIPTMNRAGDVLECVDSVINSSYRKLEIIVVDNASEDNTVKRLKLRYGKNKQVKVIESQINLWAAGGRNKGAEFASGKYFLFVDSDNIVDQEMIKYLVHFMESHPECGMVGPLTLMKVNPELITQYFADINMWTSQAVLKGCGEKNKRQYDEVIKVGHLPNCLMLRANDFKIVGGFDEKYMIIYEEADLAEQVKKILKKKIYVYSKAITYHGDVLPKDSQSESFLGFRSSQRAFLTARNRIYFINRNTNWMQKVAFFLIFNWVIMLYYQFNLLKKGQFDKALAYFNGFIQGFFM